MKSLKHFDISYLSPTKACCMVPFCVRAPVTLTLPERQLRCQISVDVARADTSKYTSGPTRTSFLEIGNCQTNIKSNIFGQEKPTVVPHLAHSAARPTGRSIFAAKGRHGMHGYTDQAQSKSLDQQVQNFGFRAFFMTLGHGPAQPAGTAQRDTRTRAARAR
jgi:hypothetical protein